MSTSTYRVSQEYRTIGVLLLAELLTSENLKKHRISFYIVDDGDDPEPVATGLQWLETQPGNTPIYLLEWVSDDSGFV